MDMTYVIAQTENIVTEVLEGGTSTPESTDDFDGVALCYTFSILLFLVGNHEANQADRIRKLTSGIYAVLKKQGAQCPSHINTMMVAITYEILKKCNQRYKCIDSLLLRKISGMTKECEGSGGQL